MFLQGNLLLKEQANFLVLLRLASRKMVTPSSEVIRLISVTGGRSDGWTVGGLSEG